MVEADPKQPGEAASLPPEAAGTLTELAQSFLTLEHATSFYPEGHQARLAPLERCHRAALALLGRRGEATLGFVEEELSWAGQLYGNLPPVLRKFVEALGGQGIASITFAAGLEPAELVAFVARLGARRAAGSRSRWEEDEQSPHLRVEGVDYGALMAEEASETVEKERRRALWRSLLLRCLADERAALSPEELAVLASPGESPAELAALLVEALGPEASAQPGAAVEPLQRLAAAVGRAVAEGGEPAAGATAERFREIARNLPERTRFDLLDASLGAGPEGFFSRTFGAAPPSQELMGLLAGSFAMDPGQITRITRVFQHFVPRQLERMELAPFMRNRMLDPNRPEEGLAENSWEEVQELLTGEGAEFLSESYLEMLQRLTAREEVLRGAEASLASVKGLVPDLAPARTAEETLRIQLEELHLATGPEPFGETLAALGGRCRVAWSAGDRELGLLLLDRLAEAGEGPPERREAVDAALRGVAAAEAAPELLRAYASGAARATLRALLLGASETVAGPALDAFAAERDPARRRVLAELLVALGAPAVAEALRRLDAAPPDEAWAFAAALGELRAPAAVPGLVAALRRDHPRLRREALRALVAIDAPEARRALPALLADDDDEIVQIAATHLGAIGDREAARRLLRLVNPGLLGRRAAGAKRAILALGRMRSPEAVAPLARLLVRRGWTGRGARADLGESAAQALWRIGGPDARRALEEAAAAAAPPVAAACRKYLARWSAS